jgi:carboxyl-terminal processing protease
MKKLIIAILILIFNFPSFADQVDTTLISFEPLFPEMQHRQESRIISHLLTYSHYKKIAIDDSLSSQAFNHYIGHLDYNHLYFLQSDINSFEKYRYMFDDYFRSGQIETAFEIFDIYEKRVAKRLEYVFSLLNQEFNFNIDEYIVLDRSDSPWAKTNKELDEIWRKRIKYEALNLKLAGKDWDGIVKTLRNRYNRVKRNISQYQSEDVFQLLMNSLSESFDPHTNYFSPKGFDNFKIQMSQSLEGIGARLSTENEYTNVVEIVPGGPADKSQKLFPNDRILGVAQGVDGELVDVVGWRIDDVVQLIRGKKGTVVRLQLLRAGEHLGSPTETISLVRDKIKLEDQSAKGDTIQIMHQGKKLVFGIINVPVFYSDYEGRRNGDNDYKSTTRDVKRLIEDLKLKGVDGIIIDLRHNGGGFLNEAVDLAGLFIDKGPVVQVRDSHDRVNVERDTDPSIVYDGPLAVVIDRLSASASEIFAAAIQDYQRGIIIGSQSFGKGTVQNAIDLNRFVRDTDKKLGELKLTVAKFYRINGGSTQNKGVIPDITFPSRYSYMDIGESNSKNALLWDKIKPVQYSTYGLNSDVLPLLVEQHNIRMENSPQYSEVLEKISDYEEKKSEKQVSLMESKRQAEMDKEEKQEKESDSAEEDTESESQIKKDFLLKESAHVLGDYLMLTKTQSALK